MLSTILGQESVVAVLRGGLKTEALSQTLLFVGDPHIGKTTTAIALAKALLCRVRKADGDDSCDVCADCKMVDGNTHPDLRSVSPSGPSRMLRMAQFWPRDGVKDHPPDRAMLRDLHFTPVGGKRRIFIVESAESMNEDTANSLLKVLEEPPPYAQFILTTTSVEAILPTIFSRSQTLRFRPIPEPIIYAELTRRGISAKRAAYLAGFSQGKPGNAIRGSTSEAGLNARDAVLEIAAESSRTNPVIAAFRIADDLRKVSTKLADSSMDGEESSGRTLLSLGCELLLSWYRDMLVRLSTNHTGRVFNSDRVEEIDRLCNQYTTEELLRAIDLVQDTKRYIARNANAQIATEYLMINLLSLGSLRR